MAIIETDPRVQAMFDENAAVTRRANVEISETLKADQARLAAEAKERDERFASARSELAKEAEELGKKGAEPQRKPQWEQKDRSVAEMSFGMEEDDEPLRAAPPPPPVAPPPPPVSRPAPRRPAPRDDDDDDLSGQTWLS